MPLATPQTIAEITADWIDDVLRSAGAISSRRVAAVAVRPIGDSVGYLSSMAAVGLTYEGLPASDGCADGELGPRRWS